MKLKLIPAAVLYAVMVIPTASQAADKLNVLCAADNDWCEVMRNAFEKETKVEVSMVRKSAGEIFAQIRAEASNPKTDIWWAGTGDPHLQAAADGFTEVSNRGLTADYGTTGDGLVAALQLLAVVKRQEKPVSEVCHCFEPLPQILKNVRYKQGRPLEEKPVVSAIKAAEQLLGGSGRLVIRPSGTEPVIRVMAEGDDRDLVMRAVDEVVEAVTKAAA